VPPRFGFTAGADVVVVEDELEDELEGELEDPQAPSATAEAAARAPPPPICKNSRRLNLLDIGSPLVRC